MADCVIWPTCAVEGKRNKYLLVFFSKNTKHGTFLLIAVLIVPYLYDIYKYLRWKCWGHNNFECSQEVNFIPVILIVTCKMHVWAEQQVQHVLNDLHMLSRKMNDIYFLYMVWGSNKPIKNEKNSLGFLLRWGGPTGLYWQVHTALQFG